MPRKFRAPGYLHHKATGQAFVRLDGHDYYLGRYDTPESRAAYDRLIADWLRRRAGHAGVPAPPPARLSVGALAARFLEHATAKYQGPERIKELLHYRQALTVLDGLHGRTPAADFGPKALREVRDAMAGKWSASTANHNLTRLKTMLRWLAQEELLPEARLQALLTVPGLPRDPEEPDVPPVPEADLAATWPELNPVVRALCGFLLHTAARPSEACRLTPADLHREGRVEIARGITAEIGDLWAVRYDRHKTHARTRRPRIILVGPRAQAILRPFLEGRPPGAAVFSPKEAAEAWLAAAERSLGPAGRARAPGARYDVPALNHAIVRACERALGLPEALRARKRRAERLAWRAANCWSVGQLRHNAASRLREEFGNELGLELGKTILGHTSTTTTLLYALTSYRQAAEAVRRIG
jgi:integrase